MAMLISSMETFFHGGRENHSIVSELDGALLISKDPFPYFMLIAFEAGGPLRALALLLLSPFLYLLERFGFDDMALRIMIFVSMVFLRVADVKAVAKATLPRFYLEDVRESAYRVFSSCGGKKCVITSGPRIMVEPVLREYLGVDHVIGTEMSTVGGYCLGLVASPGVMAGVQRLESLRVALRGDEEIDVGLCSGLGDHPFMLLCRESYLIPPEEKASPLPRRDYPTPLIFHDGRFVARPTPLDFLGILLWLPLGVLLAVSRILVGVLLPYELGLLGCAATGFRIRAQFPKAHCTCETRCTRTCDQHTRVKRGTLYVCSHRTLMDPVMVSTTLQRKVTAVTYSLSVFSEWISPIPTVRLTRDRSSDGAMMQSLLDRGDLVVCPEGTTCREPYLLRFSPLFAEIAEDIVPIAVRAEGSMFFGTTVRGYKWLDSFFFLMNPSPCYSLQFLEKQSGDSKSSYDVANQIQRSIGRALGYECTNFTRRDKYRMIAGNDGVVGKN